MKHEIYWGKGKVVFFIDQFVFLLALFGCL